MLKDSLYTIQKITDSGKVIEASVELNVEHEIFKGHFPVHPVLPGACIVHIIKEILELSFNEKLQLAKAEEIKFLRMIEPQPNTPIIFSIECDSEKNLPVNISAIITKDNIVCCKMKAFYKAGS